MHFLCRDDSPSVRSLIHSDFMSDWCRANHAKTQGAAKAANQTRASQRSTKAAQGHAAAAQRRLDRRGTAPEPFKLERFKAVQSRVCSFRDAQGR